MATGSGRKRRGSARTADEETRASAPTGGQTDPVPVWVPATGKASVEDAVSGADRKDGGRNPGVKGQEAPSEGERRLSGTPSPKRISAALAAVGLTFAGLAGMPVYQMIAGDGTGLWNWSSVSMVDGPLLTASEEPPPARSPDAAANGAAPAMDRAEVHRADAQTGAVQTGATPKPPPVPPPQMAVALTPVPPPPLPPERSQPQPPPLRSAAASPMPQRKPKATPSKETAPVAAVPTAAVAPAGAAIVLTVGQSTVRSTLRALGPGSSDRLWPDRTREIAYRFGRHRILAEGIAVTGVTLWFDPQGVLAAARVQDALPGLYGNPGSVAVLPAAIAGY